jgi:dienelactone hydrolase
MGARRGRLGWMWIATVFAALITITTPAYGTTARPQREQVAYPVGVRTDTFVDSTRPTPEVAAIGVAGAPTRTIPVTTWFPEGKPARGKRFPLIVYAHGNGARGANTPELVKNWAARGYVVVAPDFPVSSRARSTLDAISDFEAQPRDVQFVIDQLLDKRGDNELARTINPRRIGVAGHSLGAITALAVAYGALSDPRVDAVISFAGLPLLDGTNVASRPMPLLLVHGDNDSTIPVGQSQMMFQKAVGPHYFITIIGGGHSPYLHAPDPETAQMLSTVTNAFWDAYLRGERRATDRIAPLAVPGRFLVETATTP